VAPGDVLVRFGGAGAKARQRLRAWLLSRGYLVERLTGEELRSLRSWGDSKEQVDNPPRRDDPRLQFLQERYQSLDWPVVRHTRWADRTFIDFARFRGDSLYVWHYREHPRVTALKYFMFLCYVEEHDPKGWVEALGEDGTFGCWTFTFAGRGPVSRDLLDSVNELTFLEDELHLSGWDGLSVLDVGAGYGRLAHRATQALPGLREWACVDAVPESTYLSDYYLRYRGVTPPAQVLELTDVPALSAGRFDVAVNVHSFSECSLAAVEWWARHLARLAVPHLFVVPNEHEGFLTVEGDGTRRDYRGALERAGYRLTTDKPAFDDPAVRELLGVHDRYCLFESTRA
jgi:SAM-dependent methyltransferase